MILCESRGLNVTLVIPIIVLAFPFFVSQSSQAPARDDFKGRPAPGDRLAPGSGYGANALMFRIIGAQLGGFCAVALRRCHRRGSSFNLMRGLGGGVPSLRSLWLLLAGSPCAGS